MKHLIKFNESSSKLPYEFVVILGDDSGDGHSLFESYKISSSLPLDIVREYYRQATMLIDFDIRDYCNDYEDSSIPEEEYNKLLSLDIITKRDGSYDCIYSSGYLAILLNMVKQVDPSYEWKIVIDDYKNQWSPGGYGLFSHG